MKSQPLRVFLVYSFITSALYQMIFTVNLLYYILVAKLDPLQLVLVGTFLEASVFVFEVPTGVMADAVSRRLSIIIGIFLVGISFLINGIWPVFWVIALAQVLWGLGYTFTSGAQQAWISDELGEENATAAFLAGSKMEQWGGLSGTILSMGVAFLSLRAPILAGGGLFLVLGVYLLLRMPETGFVPHPQNGNSNWHEFSITLKNGLGMIKRRPALLTILGVGFFFGLFSEGYDRLWQAHVLEKFNLPALPFFTSFQAVPDVNLVFWFGLLKILMMAVSAITLAVVARNLTKPAMNTLRLGLIICSAILVAGLLGFALAGSLGMILAAILVIGVVREVINPIYTGWVNHRLDSSVRATVISLSSQVDAIGQITGGPVVGVIARQISITAGLLTSSLLLTPVLVLLGIQKDREEKAV